jgi:hypothetical protein
MPVEFPSTEFVEEHGRDAGQASTGEGTRSSSLGGVDG